MGGFLFTKLLNLLCLLLCQYHFSDDGFLVSPTITRVRSLCGPYRWTLQFRVSAGCAPFVIRWGSRLLDQSRRQALLGKFYFNILQLILGSYVLKRCWKWFASACRHVSHATNTLFISNQSSADEMKAMHYAGLLLSVLR